MLIAVRSDVMNSFLPHLYDRRAAMLCLALYCSILFCVTAYNNQHVPILSVFHLQVTPYTTHKNKKKSGSAGLDNAMDATPFYNTREGSWVVVKTQRCLEKLHHLLEQYVGKEGLPCLPMTTMQCEEDGNSKGGVGAAADRCIRKPADWDISKWLTHRTQTMADYFLEFKNPKRGLYMGDAPPKEASLPSAEYTHNPLLGSVLGFISQNSLVIDEFTLQQQQEKETYQRMCSSKNPNKYLGSKADAYWIKQNDAPLVAVLDFENSDKKTEHLIHGLPPLAQFLHTDKVTLVVSTPSQSAKNSEEKSVPHYELRDNDLIAAGRQTGRHQLFMCSFMAWHVCPSLCLSVVCFMCV